MFAVDALTVDGNEARPASQVRNVLLRRRYHLAVVGDALFKDGDPRVVVTLLLDRLFNSLEALGKKIDAATDTRESDHESEK